MLNAGNSARPRFTSLNLRWQGLDGGISCGAAWEAAVGDHVERLAVEHFLEITVLAALLFDERLGVGFGAGAEDLHDEVAGGLAAVPAAAGSASLGNGGDWFFSRLGGWRWSGPMSSSCGCPPPMA